MFLKFLCFLYDPANPGKMTSDYSSFSKPSLDIWKFLVPIMLKSSMQDFKHDLTSMEDEYKKDPNELDYFNGVVSHPEPDI